MASGGVVEGEEAFFLPQKRNFLARRANDAPQSLYKARLCNSSALSFEVSEK